MKGIYSEAAQREARRRHDVSVAKIRKAIRDFLLVPLQVILQLLPGFQDALLALPFVRALCLFVFEDRLRSVFHSALRLHSQIDESFDNLEYFVSDDAKKLLLHAAQHAIMWDAKAHRHYTTSLPNIGRVLLNAPGSSGRYQVSWAPYVMHPKLQLVHPCGITRLLAP